MHIQYSYMLGVAIDIQVWVLHKETKLSRFEGDNLLSGGFPHFHEQLYTIILLIILVFIFSTQQFQIPTYMYIH